MKKNRKFHYAWWILVALSVIVRIGKGAVNNSTGLFLQGVTITIAVSMFELLGADHT